MCGINGFNWNDKELIMLMNDKIRHRGPDDDGIFTNEEISLGQVRLSILDLTNAGHQPMFYSKEFGAVSKIYNNGYLDRSKVAIVFNGEIYNYLEIKKELESKGYVFTTKTDTEVILASYLEWGFDCVKKFNGMWAFAIYDLEKKFLFLSRDRLGQKPLYYYLKNGRFIFSSELKGILEHKDLKINSSNNVNLEALELYFNLGFVPSPYSIFKDVYKLEARKNLVFDLKTKDIREWSYWKLPNYNPIYDKKRLISEGKKLLNSAVRLRMRSDVPVGAFLSGGLDSSTVVGVMKDYTDSSKLHTFSIGFSGKYDETPYIKVVKDYFKTKHHHYYFKENDFEELLGTYFESYDEPFADYSGFPTHKVSQIAKQYVTVSLSGDGGDEIFAGYTNHLTGARLDLIYLFPKIVKTFGSKLPVKRNLNSVNNFYLLKEAFRISLNKKEEILINSLSSDVLKTDMFKKWIRKNFNYSLEKANYNIADAMRVYDLLFNTLSDNFLVKVDRASMRYALEVRSPFLDYRLVEFSQRIPTKWKVDIFKTKKLMREIIKDILPEKIVNRGKQGFEPPLKEWLFKSLKEKDYKRFNNLLKNYSDELYKFYNEKVLKENNKFYNIYRIRLYMFAKWYEKWVK